MEINAMRREPIDPRVHAVQFRRFAATDTALYGSYSSFWKPLRYILRHLRWYLWIPANNGGWPRPFWCSILQATHSNGRLCQTWNTIQAQRGPLSRQLYSARQRHLIAWVKNYNEIPSKTLLRSVLNRVNCGRRRAHFWDKTWCACWTATWTSSWHLRHA